MWSIAMPSHPALLPTALLEVAGGRLHWGSFPGLAVLVFHVLSGSHHGRFSRVSCSRRMRALQAQSLRCVM